MLLNGMKQEDKELLLRDLCARLSYGVKCKISYNSDVINDVDGTLYGIDKDGFLMFDEIGGDYREFLCKPYLFPLSSITEEQKKEYYSLADDVTIKPGQACCLGIKIHCIKLGISDNPHEEVWDYINLDALDWLNKNHFDYRGLIPMGLANDATGLKIY